MYLVLPISTGVQLHSKTLGTVILEILINYVEKIEEERHQNPENFCWFHSLRQ
jgi:hypothetical protein